jgi:SHAQKYF class myb-like DNA-binding protein
MVCIPDGPTPLREPSLLGVDGDEDRGVTSPFDSVSTPTTSVAEKVSSGEEKIGRWTEEEHQIFLKGLEIHGKQWKTIASMIGTRTVVQVRTHAQKYFQKLERKNRNKNNSNNTAASSTDTTSSNKGKPKAGKRKSLPTALPSSKKTKTSKKSGVQRSASLSLSAFTGPPIL